MVKQPKVADNRQKKVAWERQYGEYKIEICVAVEERPGTGQNVLSAIMQAYRHRMEAAHDVNGGY